jgi:hypothetical protein
MRRSAVHSPSVRPKGESALEHVRRISREHNKPFDPSKRGTWQGSSKDLVVNGHRKGDRHGRELIEGEEEFVVIEQEPDDRNPFILVNPLDYQGNKLFGLNFEYHTNILVWARHLENALEPAAEWLEKYAPGLLVSREEEQRLFEEVKEEYPDIDDEEAQEKATADLTYTEAGYIGVEWGVSFDSDVHGKDDEIYKAALEASKEEYEEQYNEQAPNKRGAHRRNAGKSDGMVPGARVRLSGKFLRSTGQYTGGAGQSVWTILDLPAGSASWVVVNEEADTSLYTAAELADDPSLKWRRIARANLVLVGRPDHGGLLVWTRGSTVNGRDSPSVIPS